MYYFCISFHRPVLMEGQCYGAYCSLHTWHYVSDLGIKMVFYGTSLDLKINFSGGGLAYLFLPGSVSVC